MEFDVKQVFDVLLYPKESFANGPHYPVSRNVPAPKQTLVLESFSESLSTSIFLTSKFKETQRCTERKSLLINLYKEIEAALYKPNAESICRQFSQKKIIICIQALGRGFVNTIFLWGSFQLEYQKLTQHTHNNSVKNSSVNVWNPYLDLNKKIIIKRWSAFCGFTFTRQKIIKRHGIFIF